MATCGCNWAAVSDLETALAELTAAQRDPGSAGVVSVSQDGASVTFDRKYLNQEIAQVRKLLARRKGCRPLFRALDLSQ